MKCKAIKTDVEQCQANAMHGGKYCFRHDQETREQALSASSDGGKAKRQYHPLGRRMKLDSLEDIKKLMEKAINSLWTGKMPASNPAAEQGILRFRSGL